MELAAQTWTEEENYLNVEERDHKSASKKDSKPSFKFVNCTTEMICWKLNEMADFHFYEQEYS